MKRLMLAIMALLLSVLPSNQAMQVNQPNKGKTMEALVEQMKLHGYSHPQVMQDSQNTDGGDPTLTEDHPEHLSNNTNPLGYPF